MSLALYVGQRHSPRSRRGERGGTGIKTHRRPTTSERATVDPLATDSQRATIRNASTATLVEAALRRDEGHLADGGSLVVQTGRHTGRSPQDKFVVREPSSQDDIWWGTVNRPLEQEQFDGLYQRLRDHLRGRDRFVQDLAVGADPAYQLPIRVITEDAWQSLFARHLFIVPDGTERREPEFTVIAAPRFTADPARDGTRTETVIAVDFGQRLIVIGGTHYAGEIKKSIFSVMNYLLPQRGVFPMHCSANVGPAGDVALFFGLSGTGKTTLSADPERRLIGDDEHGWSDQGVFNFEGGCYAKAIHLSAEAEPEIFATTRMFGTVLENVVLDPSTGQLDLDDESLTENTRAAYPLSSIPTIEPSGMGGHPTTIVILTADAFGVLPPIARLSNEQAMYHFLSGYTAKVAGTERGVSEPEATFSACFGSPFLPLPPTTYVDLLGQKLDRHDAQVWLINTGWSGGPYGVGERFPIAYTRAMVRAALDGRLDAVPLTFDRHFGLAMPTACPDVPPDLLDPRATWRDDDAYDRQATKLAAMFRDNFANFAGAVPAAVREAGPPAS